MYCVYEKVIVPCVVLCSSFKSETGRDMFPGLQDLGNAIIMHCFKLRIVLKAFITVYVFQSIIGIHEEKSAVEITLYPFSVYGVVTSGKFLFPAGITGMVVLACFERPGIDFMVGSACVSKFSFQYGKEPGMELWYR